jgi:hypothetical protein
MCPELLRGHKKLKSFLCEFRVLGQFPPFFRAFYRSKNMQKTYCALFRTLIHFALRFTDWWKDAHVRDR